MAEFGMIPASIRNLNPGAMYPGPVATRFGSTTCEVLHSKDGEHKIATFPDGVSGAAAMMALLASPAYTGHTLEAAIRKWCGGYRPESYLGVLKAKAGVARDTVLTVDLLQDAAFAVPLCKAMAVQEAGQAFPLSDAEWGAAHALAFPNSGTEQANLFTVKPNSVSPAGPLRRSGTLWGALGAGASGVLAYLEEGWQVMLGTIAAMTEIQPLRDSLASVAGNSKSIAFSLTLGCLALVICRRIKAAGEGKAG